MECPTGYYCPKGSSEPHKCGFFAPCTPGSERNRDFLSSVIFVVLALSLGLYRSFVGPSKSQPNNESGNRSGKTWLVFFIFSFYF